MAFEELGTFWDELFCPFYSYKTDWKTSVRPDLSRHVNIYTEIHVRSTFRVLNNWTILYRQILKISRELAIRSSEYDNVRPTRRKERCRKSLLRFSTKIDSCQNKYFQHRQIAVEWQLYLAGYSQIYNKNVEYCCNTLERMWTGGWWRGNVFRTHVSQKFA